MGTIQNVIVVHDYAYINGGAAKVAIQSAMGLAEQGLQVIFFSAVGPADRELESKVRVICLHQQDLRGASSRIKGAIQGLWNSCAGKQFARLLSEFDPKDTVVHVHGWTKALSASVFAAAQRRNFTIYVTLHDYFSTCPNGGYYNHMTRRICDLKPLSPQCVFCNCDKRSYGQKLYRLCRQVVQNRLVRDNRDIRYLYISENNRKVAGKWLPKGSRLIGLQNPIELHENIQTADIQNCDCFLYIGRIDSEKGVDLFCEAITRSNLKGIAIGDGEQKKELQEKYPNIAFVGWKTHDEIRIYLKKARAIVFPSRWHEGAPLTIVEALSAGVSCIVSDCTSAVEVITDGYNGYMFRADDVADLCEKLSACTDEQVLKFRANIAQSFDPRIYSIRTHAEKLIKIYEGNYEAQDHQ